MALAMTGCLLPQDDQLMPDFPTLKNHAPRFLTDTAEPQQFTTVYAGQNCLTQEFKISIIDPDEGDTLRARCFLDPQLSSNSEIINDGKVFPGSMPGDAQKAKCSFNLSVGTGLAKGGQHIVKMMIADGELVTNLLTNQVEARPREATALDGGKLELANYTATYLWFATSENTPCALPDGGS